MYCVMCCIVSCNVSCVVMYCVMCGHVLCHVLWHLWLFGQCYADFEEVFCKNKHIRSCIISRVCMHVRTYAPMYVCMYVSFLLEESHTVMYFTCCHVLWHVCMYVRVHVIYVCVYVRTYVHVFSRGLMTCANMLYTHMHTQRHACISAQEHA